MDVCIPFGAPVSVIVIGSVAAAVKSLIEAQVLPCFIRVAADNKNVCLSDRKSAIVKACVLARGV